MTYVISDIHGCFDKFNQLLKKINFTDRDVMYVLGDIVDYGDEPMELLCDLSMRVNVIPVLGEREYKAYKLLSALDRMLTDGSMPEPEILSEMAQWSADGGATTIAGFKELDADMREGVLDYLSDMTLYEEVKAGGKNYLLLHAGIADFDESAELDDYQPEDFISEPLDLERKYFDGVTVVAGHTPTYMIEGAQKGRIYRTDSAILIDCGAAFGETLGCIRLEDGKEFYA